MKDELHTKMPWGLTQRGGDNEAIYEIEDSRCEEICQFYYHPDAHTKAISYLNAETNAARIIHCVNNFDKALGIIKNTALSLQGYRMILNDHQPCDAEKEAQTFLQSMQPKENLK